jgi:CDP-glucose 4,6-dehydratase
MIQNTLFARFFNNKTVFVTGHTGFIGSWLSFWLSSMGANVIGYS